MAINGPIGVLCGGPSSEREISINSGKAVYEALASKGLPVKLLVLSADRESIPNEIKMAGIKVAFIALHGAFGEDGTIQCILDELQIPYTGSSAEASHFAMDKVFARRRWISERLPVPRWVAAEPINVMSRFKGFSFPLMVKPLAQGSSIGMSLVDTPEELVQAAHVAAEYGEQILLEEYLPGQELTVGILEDQPLPVIQIVPKRRFYDYVAKYTPGMCEYRVPAPLAAQTARHVQEVALRAHQALGCRYFSRVDMILVAQRGPVLLELNTIPGMTATSLLPKAAAAVGIDFPRLCLKMLASASEGSPVVSAASGR